MAESDTILGVDKALRIYSLNCGANLLGMLTPREDG